jgi:hypothetical protein
MECLFNGFVAVGAKGLVLGLCIFLLGKDKSLLLHQTNYSNGKRR